jgi:hypothetical protein
VPRLPRKTREGSHRRRKDRQTSQPVPASRSRRLPSVHSADSTLRPASVPDDVEALGSGRRLSRRKIYRYDKTDRKKSRISPELKAIGLVIVAGLIMVIMCRNVPTEACPAEARDLPGVSRADAQGSPSAHQPASLEIRTAGGRDDAQVNQLLVVPGGHDRGAAHEGGESRRLPGH